MVHPSEIIVMNKTIMVRMLTTLFKTGDRNVVGRVLTLTDVMLNERPSGGGNTSAALSMMGAGLKALGTQTGTSRAQHNQITHGECKATKDGNIHAFHRLWIRIKSVKRAGHP